MNAVDRSDLIDVEPVDHVETQDVTILRSERAQSLVEGRFEGLGVARANVLELGIFRRAGDGEERVAFVMELRLEPFAPAVAERRAYGHGPEPAEKRASTSVLGDFRASAGRRHEELLLHHLRDFVDGRATRAKSGERRGNLTVVAAVELPKRLRAPSGAGKCEVEIVHVEALDGGRFTLRPHVLEERGSVDDDSRIGRAGGIDRSLNALSLLLEIRHRRIVG